VTFTQLNPIWHPTPGSSYDEAAALNTASAANVQVQQTLTDADGDTDTATVDIGQGVFSIQDDGPAASLNLQAALDTIVLDESRPVGTDTSGAGAPSGLASSTANFSDNFSGPADYGADGPGSVSYALHLSANGIGSGLYALQPSDTALAGVDGDGFGQGAQITLSQVGNVITGSAGGTDYFTISINSVTGVVTFTQLNPIWNPTPGSSYDEAAALNTAAAANVQVVQSVTDADGDTATASLNIGQGVFSIQDDGPVAANDGSRGTFNDSATNVNIGNVSVLLANDDYGSDGPAGNNQGITIATGSLGGTITIDGSGNMLYTSNHDTTPGNTDVETFTYTIRDADGDTATATFTVSLQESGPTIGTTAFTVDEEGLANGIAGTVYGDASDVAGQATTASGTLTGFDFGGDGAGNIVLAASADTGLRTLSGGVVESFWNAATHTLTGYVDTNNNNAIDAGETQVFTLQIDNVNTGHYVFTLLQPVTHATANTEDDKTFSVNVTVTDFDNDPANGVINITIDDDSPQVSNVAGGASVTLDETTAVTPAGFPISANSGTAVITATAAFGADGAAAANSTVYGLTLNGGVNTLASGLQTAIGDFPITLNLVDSTHITGTYVNGGTQTAFTITMNPATGVVTVQQNVPLEHLVDGSTPADYNDALDLVADGTLANLVNATITIKDGDGDTHSGSTGIGDQIVFLDDGPSINVTKGADAGVTLTTDDADTIGIATDVSTPTSINFGGVFGLTSAGGADGAAATPSLSFQLDVTGYVTAGPGVDSGLDQGGNNIYLYEIGGKVVGSTSATFAGVSGSNTVFDVGVSGTGVVTLTQYSQIDHPIGSDPTPTGTPFNDQFISLADGLVTLTASATITDNDGDTASDSEVVNIGANLHFTDDGPSAAIVTTGQTVKLDESAGNQVDSNDTTGPLAVFAGVTNVGDDPDVAGTGPIQFATNASALVASTGSLYGADGAGSTVFGLSVAPGGVDSGLDTTAGVNIFLFLENGIVVGRVGATAGVAATGPAAFAIAIDPNTGAVSTVEYLSIYHPNAGNPDDSVSITNSAVQATVTVTDSDGDTATNSVNVGSQIQFQDSGPIMTAAQNINIQNSADVAHTGAFAFNLGADGANTTNDVITNVTGSATVGGVAVQNWTLTPGAEDATTATYSFSFDYPIGGGNTAHETGTLVFNKVAGTYTIDLANPIQGVTSILQTATGTLFQGYEFGTSTPDGSQPAISVTQIQDLAGTANDIYVQFTSVAEPSSGTGNDAMEVTNWVPGANNPPPVNDPPDPTGGDFSWSAGQLFNQADSWVSTSNSANGVGGDTIQGGEVLDFTLAQGANPTGNLAQPATFAQASAMFLTFDGIGSGEDMIVVLKLYDPTTNTYTTRAVMIENSDIFKGPADNDPNTAAPALPAPYSSITLDNNDGFVVIESNDYNNPGENWVIVGAQIAGSDEGITGTAIDLNSAVGAAGDSDTNNNGALDTDPLGFQSDTNDGPFKISSIGFLTTSTTPQNAQLDFNVTVTDGDGDSITQAISATVTPAVDSVSAATIPAANTTIAPVVLDLNGDGVHFLGQDAGVQYDYGAGLVATAWAAADDGILVRDANHNGTVDNASEFVFGGNGQTDLEALHAQYGAQLDANDADFTMFAVWNDANSNGVVDGNELQSLAEAGITSIGLVSDGIAYSTANDEVTVAGTSTFTRADGSTGDAADALFSTQAAKATQDIERVAANSNTVALAAAVAAAGVVATSSAAAHGFGDGEFSAISIAPVAQAALGDAGLQRAYNSPAFEGGNAWDGGFHASIQALSGSSHTAIATSHVGELSATLSLGSGPTALLDATDFSAMMHMPAATVGMSVGMPVMAQSLVPAQAGVNAQANGTVEQIIADALHGGGHSGPSIDALLSALPGQGLGDTAGLHGLTTQLGADVPNGDMGHSGGFTFDVASIITTEAMVLHHDAVQPVANG
jgi:T1SS-143 domain-containing protein